MRKKALQTIKYYSIILKTKTIHHLPFLLAILLLTSCFLSDEKAETYHRLEKYLASQGLDIKTKQSVLILNKRGCINCNKQFAGLLQYYVDNKNVVIINLEDGNKVDISPLLIKSVINDHENKFSDYMEIENSTAVFLKNEKIDTIISIEANNIAESFHYIKTKLYE